MQLSCGNYTFVSYRVVECGSCVATNPATTRITGEEVIDPKQHLTLKLKKLFQDVGVQSKYVLSFHYIVIICYFYR